jgi:NADH-quinone oxidoreductase subunit G
MGDEGERANLDWSLIPQLLKDALASKGHLAVAISPFLTVEEAYLLASFIRSVDEQAIVGVGPVPEVGEDESFPNGFTIRSEKAPNRRGVTHVVAHWDATALDFESFLERVAMERPSGIWFAGGYPAPMIAADQVARMRTARLLVVQDLFPSELTDVADFVLPAAAYPERTGSFVNHNDRLQSFEWAIRPPSGVMTEGQLLWKMTGRGGMYRGPEILREVARSISNFSAASDAVPPDGVDLRVNLLAGV